MCEPYKTPVTVAARPLCTTAMDMFMKIETLLNMVLLLSRKTHHRATSLMRENNETVRGGLNQTCQ